MKKINTKKLKAEMVLARKKAKESFAKARTKLMHAEKQVVNYVEKNPKKAAAIAAGVGAAIGAAIALAAKRRK